MRIGKTMAKPSSLNAGRPVCQDVGPAFMLPKMGDLSTQTVIKKGQHNLITRRLTFYSVAGAHTRARRGRSATYYIPRSAI